MALGFIYFIAGFIFVILIGLIVTALILYFKEEKQPEDDTIFINYKPQFSKGYSLGIINQTFKGKKRTGIEFFPRDIDYVRHHKKKEKTKIEPQLVFFKNSQLTPLPKGRLSSERNILIGEPTDPEDLPEEIKEKEFGKDIMNKMTNKSKEEHGTSILREEINKLKALDRKIHSEEEFERYLEKIDEDRKDLKNMFIREEKKIFPSLEKK